MEVSSLDILPEGITVKKIEDLLRRIGLVLEGAWSQLGCRLIDFKIEMGVTEEGQLMVADVIDADSWRLRSADWQELSKQLFRDNVDMGQIADKYALVAQLVKQLRIPKQAIVVWRGSKDDLLPDIPTVAGISMVDVVLSGHKSPQRCLCELEKVLTKYPEGGVILACVGMSNGLGPVLSARTSWPVIGVVMTADKLPDDVWSSLRMPSQVPMVTVISPKNAVLIALNILGQKNPVAYAERQSSIEKLDE
jgi:phosphoribosylaminoimidazole carboxylase / phosphoribosylaminoimidazole-succinocarboxamide synthase